MKMIIPNIALKNNNGSTFYQYFASFSSMLAIISCGLHYGWTSPSLPKLYKKDSIIPITEEVGYWLATIPLFGSCCGSFISFLLVDKIGRYKTILLTSIPYLISWIMIVFSWNIPLLYVARFTAGIADGLAFTAVPIYVGEITQPHIRGILSSSVSVCFIIGILGINIIGSYLSIQMTAVVACIFPVTLFITFTWMPESPYFLIMTNRQADARNSLQIFIGEQAADLELERISHAVKEDISQTKSNPIKLFTLKRNRRPFLVMMIVRGCQQLSGNSAFVFYCQNIFAEAGSNISADIASIIYFSIQVICTIISAYLADKLGRRPILLFSGIGVVLALLIEGVYFYVKSLKTFDLIRYNLVPVITLILYIIFFSFGLQNVPISMLSELFNQDIKATALCFADVYYLILASTTSKFFQSTRESFGIHIPFICFSTVCAVLVIFIYFFVPETKGKTLEDIQEYFKDEKKKIKQNKVI